MILFKKSNALRNYLTQQNSSGYETSFVPTMGALHEGHLSLVKAAKKQTGLAVCSIFVNPAQFNDPKDFQKYPITPEKDICLLEKAGADILFLPAVEELYPAGITKLEHYELGYLETILEGQYRPGHFQGVCQVMQRLLNIVQPHHLFMGQKDYQQCMVIKKLLQIMQSGIIFHTCPTTREADGLAMSSRNNRLNETERKKATTIYESLIYLKKNLQTGDLSGIINNARAILTNKGFNIDYIEIADADTLELIHQWNGQQGLVALAAVFLQDVRLIDNMLLNDELK